MEDTEYLRKQGVECLEKAAGFFRRAGLDKTDENTCAMLEVIDRYLSSEKQPLSNEQKTVRVPRNLFIINDEEVRGRKEVRSYNGATIEEICQRFLFYRDNQNINNGQKNKDKLKEMLRISPKDKIYLLHDDTILNSGKNGFAITDRGMYIKELMEKPQFMSWEDFRECTELGRDGSSLKADGKSIIYMSGTEQALQLEVMLAAIHWCLN